VALAIVAVIVVGAIFGVRQIYFLGIDEGGRVSLYRGLPYDLPLGISLYSEQYSLPVQAASVPADRRESVTNHELRSHDDAVDLLDDLERAAATPQPTTPPSGGGGGQRPQGGGRNNGGANKPGSRQGGGQQGAQDRKPGGGQNNGGG
jgi:hypothetical protein